MSDSEQRSADPSAPERVDPTYSYRPSLMGAAWEFRLTPNALEWRVGRRAGRIPYGEITRVRLSFRPLTMQTNRFLTELWAAGNPKIMLASASWKSMFEQERLDDTYSAFVSELHQRIATAAPAARYDAGSPPLLYWPGVVVLVAVTIALVLLIVRAVQIPEWGGAAFIAAFMALFLWQVGTFFYRNRPRNYRPEAPPSELLPRT